MRFLEIADPRKPTKEECKFVVDKLSRHNIKARVETRRFTICAEKVVQHYVIVDLGEDVHEYSRHIYLHDEQIFLQSAMLRCKKARKRWEAAK